jgi:hypothetical protein
LNSMEPLKLASTSSSNSPYGLITNNSISSY